MAVSATVFYPNQAFWETPREIIGSGHKEFPLPYAPTHYITNRFYCVRKQNYARLAFDTTDVTDSSAYCEDEQITNETAAFRYFHRRYATIPATYSTPLSMDYTFPGFFLANVVRQPPTLGVIARVESEYFLNDDPFDPSTGIAVIPGFRVTEDGDTTNIFDYVNNGGGVLTPTEPSLTEYLALISGEDEIVAEDSKLYPYIGNIWRRDTIYVIAQ